MGFKEALAIEVEREHREERERAKGGRRPTPQANEYEFAERLVHHIDSTAEKGGFDVAEMETAAFHDDGSEHPHGVSVTLFLYGSDCPTDCYELRVTKVERVLGA
jgi:hypothetical protein